VPPPTPLLPDVLAQISRLEIRARRVVEGLVTGLHRSPYKGTSLEFSQHREYVPGDDLRHLDWKVYARSDRYHLKEYEEETNLRAYLLLDGSESMRFGDRPPETKYSYASAALASLAYLLLRQQDQVALAIFDSAVRASLPPSGHPQALQHMLEAMVTYEPHARTDLAELFDTQAREWRRRGIVFLASDLLADPDDLERGLAHLRHAGHEVVILHVLERTERTFPFQGHTRFLGLEALGELLVDPRALREAYLQSLDRFLVRVGEACTRHRVDLVPLTVGEPLGGALAAYLARRQARSRGGRR
jgi:uncharacterized protein (DUF58 family)